MLRHREAGEAVHGDVLLLHGYPQSSYMWHHLLEPIAAAGWRAVAPDLLGFGDSESLPDGEPSTWEAQVAAVEDLRQGLGLERVVLVVHDWGGLIGLRWACDHPDAVRALAIADTGFFADGRWSGLGEVLRTPGQGEEAIGAMTRETLGAVLGSVSTGMTSEAIDEYFKAFADDRRRRGQLELYRSGDFSKLEPYDGRLAALGVPTLLLWGADDAFAPVAGAHRLERELPDTELVVLDGAGHFVFDDAPAPTTAAVLSFLRGLS
jgi:pimeloyl-ACP methyl ester carboxylesterase